MITLWLHTIEAKSKQRLVARQPEILSDFCQIFKYPDLSKNFIYSCSNIHCFSTASMLYNNPQVKKASAQSGEVWKHFLQNESAVYVMIRQNVNRSQFFQVAKSEIRTIIVIDIRRVKVSAQLFLSKACVIVCASESWSPGQVTQLPPIARTLFIVKLLVKLGQFEFLAPRKKMKLLVLLAFSGLVASAYAQVHCTNAGSVLIPASPCCNQVQGQGL